jgi:hypothetical protein
MTALWVGKSRRWFKTVGNKFIPDGRIRVIGSPPVHPKGNQIAEARKNSHIGLHYQVGLAQCPYARLASGATPERFCKEHALADCEVAKKTLRHRWMLGKNKVLQRSHMIDDQISLLHALLFFPCKREEGTQARTNQNLQWDNPAVLQGRRAVLATLVSAGV